MLKLMQCRQLKGSKIIALTTSLDRLRFDLRSLRSPLAYAASSINAAHFGPEQREIKACAERRYGCYGITNLMSQTAALPKGANFLSESNILGRSGGRRPERHPGHGQIVVD